MNKSTHQHQIARVFRLGMNVFLLVVVSSCGLLGLGGDGTTPSGNPTTVPSGATTAPTRSVSVSGGTSAAPGVVGESPEAILAEVTANVYVTVNGAKHRGAYGDLVAMGSDLLTDNTGRAQVLFSNGATVRLAPNTLLTLTDHSRPAGGDWLTWMKLIIGQVWTSVPIGSLTVETPIGVGAVRGSFMGVTFHPGNPDDPSDDVLTITCLEGTCTLTTDQGELQFTTGQKVVILGAGGRLPAAPQSMNQEDLDDWLANNPEILALFRANAETPAPEALATLAAAGQAELITSGGIIVGFPNLPTLTPTGTSTLTPSPTATPTNTPPAPGPSATPCVPGTLPCP